MGEGAPLPPQKPHRRERVAIPFARVPQNDPSPSALDAPLDFAPLKGWRRFLPAWFRSFLWVDFSSEYDAFLSYTWKADSRIAPVVQSILQRFLCPWHKLRARSVFRDLSCLPAGSTLETELSQRLDRSRHLIVLACPAAARSQGMEMEAQHWFSRPRNGRVLIIITEGTCNTWEEIREQLLPPSIGSNLAGQPVWASLQARRDSMLRHPKSRRVRKQVVEDLKQILLAFYPGRDWGYLRGEERSQRTRLIAYVSVLSFILLILTVAAVGFARSAQTKRHEARSRELTAYAVQSLADDPERSVALAAEAVNATLRFHQPVLPVAEDTLHRALLLSHERLSLRGHTKAVNGVAYSPDGKRLVTASTDGTAKTWDAVTGRELLVFRGHAGPVRAVSFSPDGKRIATGSADTTAKIWDASEGRELLTLRGHTGLVLAVTFSADGNQLATAGSDHTAKVWDVSTGRESLTLRGHSGSISTVAFSPDNSCLATGSWDQTAKVWDVRRGRELLTLSGFKGPILALAFSPDSGHLATANLFDVGAAIWDLPSRRQIAVFRGHTSYVNALSFSPDGTRLATAGADGTAKIWDARTAQDLLTLRGNAAGLLSVVFSPDGRSLATSGLDNTANVWDLDSGHELLTMDSHSAGVHRLVFSRDGKRLAAAIGGNTAMVWDADSGQQLLTLAGSNESATGIAFSPDGRRLATTSFDTAATVDQWIRSAAALRKFAIPSTSAKIWDAATGKELFRLTGHSDSILAIAFSPDGTRLATGSADKTAKLWQADNGHSLITLGHAAGVNDVAFSPDGKLLATASGDNTAGIWDTTSGRQLFSLRGHTQRVSAVAFSPDGKRLATASDDKTARLWDLKGRRELLVFRGHASFIYAVAFSPDGKRLVTAGQDGTAKVWDAMTGEQLLTFIAHSGAFLCAAFSPDGKRLATGGTDALVQLYALDIKDLLKLAQQRITHPFTSEECRRYFSGEACPVRAPPEPPRLE